MADGHSTVYGTLITDAARLAQFVGRNPESSIRVALALRTNRLTAVDLANGVAVRLSCFSPRAVTVGCVLEKRDDPACVLEETTALSGGWDAVAAAVNPHLVSPSQGTRFFRLRR